MHRQAPPIHFDGPSKRTTEPTVVGATVIAIKYKDGVLVMADTGASYGSMARYTDIDRIIEVNPHVMLGYGGELSDAQYIETVLKQLTISDYIEMDGIISYPEEVHEYLCRIMHNYRNKANPLYNQFVTTGFTREGKSFLGYVDLYGTNYIDDIVVTGFGMYMALPLLRKTWRPDLSKEEAIKLVSDAMRVLVYRHCRTINKFSIGTFEKDGNITIQKNITLDTQWEYKRFVDPTRQETAEVLPPESTAAAAL